MTHKLINKIFSASKDIRYIAVYQNGELKSFYRPDLQDQSATETDQYEELIVNPAILLLAKQRGEIDCGGLNFVLIRYGRFFQYIKSIQDGHISVCIEKEANALTISRKIDKLLKQR